MWIGLQDNGTAKITPQGKIISTYGGDGFFVAVDPDNSNVAWEEYTNGDIRVTRDGGKSWTDNAPTMTGALFSTPFKMDETDADHLVIGGREIFETTRGAATSSDTWKQVFNLGTRTKPGVASAATAAGDPNNAMSASTMIRTSSLNVTRGDHPSRVRAFDGSPINRSTSAGRR